MPLFNGTTYGLDHVFLLNTQWQATYETYLTNKWEIFKGSLQGTMLTWYQIHENNQPFKTWDEAIDKILEIYASTDEKTLVFA